MQWRTFAQAVLLVLLAAGLVVGLAPTVYAAAVKRGVLARADACEERTGSGTGEVCMLWALNGVPLNR